MICDSQEQWGVSVRSLMGKNSGKLVMGKNSRKLCLVSDSQEQWRRCEVHTWIKGHNTRRSEGSDIAISTRELPRCMLALMSALSVD